MTIWIFTICRNRADILPFWIRHYASFADKILVWDDRSDDGSRELLQHHPLVQLRDWPYDTGIDEDKFLEFAYQSYPQAAGEADWVMWVDTDEFIHHPDIKTHLGFKTDVDLVRPQGFNMMHEGLPKDDGRQIWEICPMGVYAPVYSKPVIFRPSVTVRWNRGKHALENCRVKSAYDPTVKLLHYRYLGFDYTRKRNSENYARVPGDKGAAWTCHPDWKGEHSPEWAARSMSLSKPVI